MNSKLEGMIKSLCMLIYGFETLDQILGVGKTLRDMKGIRFDYSSLNIKSKFIPPVKRSKFITSNYMSQHHVRHHYQHISAYNKTSWMCHYRGKQGHIRLFCYKFYGIPYYHYQHLPIRKTSKDWSSTSMEIQRSKHNSHCLHFLKSFLSWRLVFWQWLLKIHD